MTTSATMQPISGCRSCGSEALLTVLELGRVPLANALLAEADLGRDEPIYPLTLLFCRSCCLVQIEETVSPEVLFGNYPYLSSFSDTMLAHAERAAEAFARRFGLGGHSLVIEIASNDGYLLRNFVARGIPVLGIDPARNVARVAEQRGVPTLCDFFGLELAGRLAAQGRSADLIIANNVIAHVADLNGVAAGIMTLLKPGGVAVLEFPYVGQMIEGVEFDTIYHEHLCYFSLHSIRELFARHGLELCDVERLSIHGGSLRVFLQQAPPSTSPAVRLLEDEESRKRVTDPEYYSGFARRVDRLRHRLVDELHRRKEQGQALAAYGASAKGSTLMSCCRLGAETLDFVVDRSTVKQGMYTPGNHLPILPPQALVERRPDAVLLLTWNFADEIYKQQAEYLHLGGEFIVPVPEVQTVAREVLR